MTKRWFDANRERHKASRDAWYERNREAKLAANAEWERRKAAESPEYFRKKQSKRRAALHNAIISESYLDEIKDVYDEARRLELQDGIQRHVDHIVPLRGRNVCGLHVPWNLQIIPASENQRKSNRLDHAVAVARSNCDRVPTIPLA